MCDDALFTCHARLGRPLQSIPYGVVDLGLARSSIHTNAALWQMQCASSIIRAPTSRATGLDDTHDYGYQSGKAETGKPRQLILRYCTILYDCKHNHPCFISTLTQRVSNFKLEGVLGPAVCPNRHSFSQWAHALRKPPQNYGQDAEPSNTSFLNVSFVVSVVHFPRDQYSLKVERLCRVVGVDFAE